MAVARFAAAHADRLVELDVNPLIVRAAGQGAVAADVLIRLAARRSECMSEVSHGSTRGRRASWRSCSTGPRPTPSTAPPAARWARPSPPSATTRSCASPSSPAAARSSSAPAGTSRRRPTASGPDTDYGVGGFGGLQELPGLNKPVIAAAQRHGGRRRLRAGAVLRPDPGGRACPLRAARDQRPARWPMPRPSSCRAASPTMSPWTCCSPAAGWTPPRPSAGAWSTRSCPPTACCRAPARSRGCWPTARRWCSPRSRRPCAGREGICRSSQAFDLVTQKRLPTVKRLYESEDPARGCPRLRREAQAGLEGPLRRLCLKPRSRAPRHRGSP